MARLTDPAGLTRRAFAAALGGMTVLTPTAAAWAQGAATAWPEGRRAAVSLTYDDGLDSQLDNAVPQLDALGLKATFFVTGENMDARLKDWVALGRAGHEIADHTVTHPCHLGAYSADAFQRRELGAMETYLNDNFGAEAGRSFAYPCGVMDLGRGTAHSRRARYLRLLRADFASARTVSGPPNDPRRLTRDRYALHAFEPTYDEDRTEPAVAYVAKAIARGYWAILVFHEVLEKRLGEGDTSLGVHGAILKAITQAPVWCAPVSSVLDHIQRGRGDRA